MKISSRDFISLVKNPSEKFFAYLLHGLDAGLIDERTNQLALLYTKNLDDPFSVSRLKGKDIQTDPALLTDTINAMGLFGSIRIIILSGTATELAPAIKININNLNSDCRLIISAKESTSRHSLVTMCEKHPRIASIACYPDEAEQLQQLISETLFKQEINISPELLKYASGKLGPNRAINKSEIEKIVLYAATKKVVSKEDIDILLGDNSSQILDRLIDNVFSGKTEKLGALLSQTRLDGVQPIVIIRFFQSYIKLLISINASVNSGLSAQLAVNNMRPPIFFKRKQSVVSHSKIFSIKHCSNLLEKFTQLEKQFKSESKGDPYSLIGQSLLGIAISSSRHRV